MKSSAYALYYVKYNIMTHGRTFQDIRREYGVLSLDEAAMPADPVEQFHLWFKDILQSECYDPTAAVLSTVDAQGHPDSRVILLKEVAKRNFLFYTNYHSTKAQQLDALPYAALNFYWPEMARQVRIRGQVKKASPQHSDAYFASRPLLSQLAATASAQSTVIANRKMLEARFNELLAEHKNHSVERPKHWGGYVLTPDEFEFWQGRDNRLHDRIHYRRQNKQWLRQRLAP